MDPLTDLLFDDAGTTTPHPDDGDAPAVGDDVDAVDARAVVDDAPPVSPTTIGAVVPGDDDGAGGDDDVASASRRPVDLSLALPALIGVDDDPVVPGGLDEALRARGAVDLSAPAVSSPSLPAPAGDDGASTVGGDSDGDADDVSLAAPVVGGVDPLHHDAMMTLDAPGMLDPHPFDLDCVLTDALVLGASDVHIYADRPIRLRINGSLYRFLKYEPPDRFALNEMLSDAEGAVITNELQDSYAKSGDADAAYVVRRGPSAGARFRGHYSTEGGRRSMTMRHVNDTFFTPEQIKLDRSIVDWGMRTQGLYVVTGPTGSGKTSLLATILHEAQRRRPDKISTIESPVEYTYHDDDGLALVVQREVPTDVRSFDLGVQAAMRDDPDVLLIGECRDAATMMAALAASNTGHLAFTTIHANSAPDTITRIIDFFDKDDVSRIRADLVGNLRAVLSQRLTMAADKRSRVAVREVLIVDDEVRAMIERGDYRGMTARLQADDEDMPAKLAIGSARGMMDPARSRALSDPYFERFDEVFARERARSSLASRAAVII